MVIRYATVTNNVAPARKQCLG